MAFFTVALNVLEFDETLSNRKRKDLDGIFSKRNNKPIQNMPVFLIGQLAKNELYDGGPFCGQVIVDHALHELAKAQMHVGGRIVLVECKQEEKLISFYKEYGFDEFTHIPDDMRKENMVQFIMKL